MNPEHPPPLWEYIEKNLENRGLTTGDLAKATGVHRSRFTKWRQGDSISIPTARAIAALFETSVVEVLVVAGLIGDDEARLQRARPDPAALTNEELVAELRRRLSPGSAPGPAAHAVDLL
ncbi:helix-turn-helix transcriptional regulator [Actinosynnema sp. NPDC023587]|uniref:helix-turn-helix transcriptional regulator n=1 Tax=Actinosynnema sp. NPDC023587 TaxID=3154695 RepID=UPI0033D03A4B